MTANRDPDLILAAWLDEGPTDLPGATRRAIVTALPTIAQRRRLGIDPWLAFGRSALPRLAAVAFVAAVAVAVALFVARPLGPGTPSPSPAGPSPTPAPTIELVGFTSPLYGYSIDYPAAWTPTPATVEWSLLGSPVVPEVAWVDEFYPRGSTLGAFVGIAAVRMETVEVGPDEWLALYATAVEQSDRPCKAPASAWTDATVAGQPARRVEGPCDLVRAGTSGPFVEYAWVADGSAYVITGTASIVELMVQSFRPGAS